MGLVVCNYVPWLPLKTAPKQMGAEHEMSNSSREKKVKKEAKQTTMTMTIEHSMKKKRKKKKSQGNNDTMAEESEELREGTMVPSREEHKLWSLHLELTK